MHRCEVVGLQQILSAGLLPCGILTTIPAAAIPFHTDPSRLAAESICVPTWKFCTNRMCSTSTKTEARQAKLKLIGLSKQTQYVRGLLNVYVCQASLAGPLLDHEWCGDDSFDKGLVLPYERQKHCQKHSKRNLQRWLQDTHACCLHSALISCDGPPRPSDTLQ